jgi:hypothetical protein
MRWKDKKVNGPHEFVHVGPESKKVDPIAQSSVFGHRGVGTPVDTACNSQMHIRQALNGTKYGIEVLDRALQITCEECDRTRGG